MKKILLLGVSVLLPVISVIVIKNEISSLDCFNSATKHNLDDAPIFMDKSLAVNIGNWFVFEEVNPVDDSQMITLILPASSSENNLTNGASIIVRCQSHKTQVYINWNKYLGGETSVLTRIDSDTAVTSQWTLSTDRKATFHKNPPALLNMLDTADRLVAQITPYNDNPITAIFDIKGLSSALIPLRKACS